MRQWATVPRKRYTSAGPRSDRSLWSLHTLSLPWSVVKGSSHRIDCVNSTLFSSSRARTAFLFAPHRCCWRWFARLAPSLSLDAASLRLSETMSALARHATPATLEEVIESNSTALHSYCSCGTLQASNSQNKKQNKNEEPCLKRM